MDKNLKIKAKAYVAREVMPEEGYLLTAYRAYLTGAKESKDEYINSGIWLAITEFAFHHESRQLLEEVIRAIGFSYEECIYLMEQCDTNRDIIEPYVNSIFGIEEQ